MTIAEKLLVDSLLQVAAFYQTRFQHVAISKIIRLLRKRLRMSQKTLAKRAKIPQATLSRIESGKNKPNLSLLEKIFKALFCEIALIPIPKESLDNIVKEEIHRIAKKRVQYLKGTMSLELQQPIDEVIRELIAKEERELLANEKFDIWQEGTLDENE